MRLRPRGGKRTPDEYLKPGPLTEYARDVDEGSAARKSFVSRATRAVGPKFILSGECRKR